MSKNCVPISCFTCFTQLQLVSLLLVFLLCCQIPLRVLQACLQLVAAPAGGWAQVALFAACVLLQAMRDHFGMQANAPSTAAAGAAGAEGSLHAGALAQVLQSGLLQTLPAMLLAMSEQL